MNAALKRRLKRALTGLMSVIAVLALCIAVLTLSGLDERWARGAVVGQIEKMTGTRAELGAFHFKLFGLSAELDNLTLHGRETEGMPPLAHVDKIRVSVRIVSFWSHRVALNELAIERPAVAVRIGEDGSSNVPAPKTPTSPRPLRTRLFDLAIQKLRIEDGTLLFNDTRVPLAAEGDNFQFSLSLDAPAPGRETYVGKLDWQKVELAARRYLPFRSNLSAKFTLGHDMFSLDELRWKWPHSELQARAELGSFRLGEWKFHYRGRASLADVRTILRKPNSPGGDVDFSGDGSYAKSEWAAGGHWMARDFSMPYRWFHAGGIEGDGRFEVARRRLQVPSFTVHLLGGTIAGKMGMDFHGPAFRVDSQTRGVNLAALLAAVDNPSFPMHTLHWGGSVDADAVTTWTAEFKHMRAKGESRWTPTAAAADEIAAGARLDFDYSMDDRAVALDHSEITTPTTEIKMDGLLGAEDSEIAVALDARNLLDWNAFINYLRGKDAEPRRISGRATWRGRVEGALAGPTFTGHVHALNTLYDRMDWDEIEGDITYSPEEFHLANAQARRGRSTAALDLKLELDGGWSFLPENHWDMTVKLNRAPLEDVQSLFGTAFPAHGLLSGEFHGDNTQADPRIDGTFELAQMDAWGYSLDSARGTLGVRHGELSLHNAEMRKNGGSVKGDFAYNTMTREAEFALTGTAIPLEKIPQLQSKALPLGGLANFELHGRGPLLSPAAQGRVRVTNFRAGTETVGSFEARLNSDGQRLKAEVGSLMATGKLEGQVELGLGGDFPVKGVMKLEQIDLDPFIQAGLHLTALTGHSSIDGQFAVSGGLRDASTLAVDAEITRLSLNYAYVQLENDGPVRFSYRHKEIRVEQAHLRGTETDLQIAGYARFAGDRALNLRLSGNGNLRLLGGFVKGLEARGTAQVNASLEGTLAKPRVTGKVRVADAAANYGDFPAGLSRVNGEFVFDSSRLLFDNVTAEAGGGTLSLNGSWSYAETPARFDISAAARHVRIRYPEGMSWLTGGTLRLSGTPQAGLLSGHIFVERLLLGANVDLATLIVASNEAPRGPATSSTFLRNLQLDIAVDSSSDARLEWTGARVQVEGSLRVRGTWEHPVILGNIHLLGGEMTFRGNRYTLSRGDINFANPFRLDPVLNVEATTVIQQYEITIDFTGPASHLSLSYRSDPPLPSSDIVALLALGTTGEESALRSSTAGGPNYGATALLSEAISSQLGGPIHRLFGISRFRVDPFLAGTATAQNAAARVTIEQQVTHDLTITYSSNANSDQEQVIQVAYALRREVSIVFLRDNNGTYSLEVKFTKRFK